jgi:hypothetical protein
MFPGIGAAAVGVGLLRGAAASVVASLIELRRS